MLDDAVNDTHPDIEALMLLRYRQMTASEKLRRVQELIDAVEALALSDIRRRYPTACERELKLRLASRRLPPDIMLNAFGWDVEKEGY